MANRQSYRVPGAVSPVQQGMLRETDLNQIVARARGQNGPIALPSGGRPPIWGDFDVVDVMEAQNLLARLRLTFAELPSRVRNHFDNDPQTLIRFVQDPQNYEASVSMGLIPKQAPKPPSQAQEIAEALAPLMNPVHQEDLEEHSLRPDPEAQPRRSKK